MRRGNCTSQLNEIERRLFLQLYTVGCRWACTPMWELHPAAEGSHPFTYEEVEVSGTLTGPSGSQKSVPNSRPCVLPKCAPSCPGIFLFSLSREASQSPHWDSLEPRVPVFGPHTLHIRKKDALQWWGAVLGTVARWLLLDSIHDHCGLSGVLHPTDNYQVRVQGAEPHTFRLVIGPKSLWGIVEMQDSV